MNSDTAFCSDDTFTQDGFRRWLDERPRGDINHYELINGRIVMTPPAGWPHSQIEAVLAEFISQHVRRHRLGVVHGSSAGYNLPSGDTIEPDLAFISRQRLAAGPQPVRGEFLRIVPNLVVEILSRSTARRDRTEKKDAYSRNGVDEYWIVDADRRAVMVFHLGADGYDTGETFATGNVTSQVMPELAVPVDELFNF